MIITAFEALQNSKKFVPPPIKSDFELLEEQVNKGIIKASNLGETLFRTEDWYGESYEFKYKLFQTYSNLKNVLESRGFKCSAVYSYGDYTGCGWGLKVDWSNATSFDSDLIEEKYPGVFVVKESSSVFKKPKWDE